jgi:hypothetical protein
MDTSTELPRVAFGRVVSVDAEGRPCVQLMDEEPIAAMVVWMANPIDWATCAGARVVLGFVDGDQERPVILGLLDAPPAPRRQPPDVLHLSSAQELTIECGKSLIALRADGRVEVRGTHLVSRSSGPNKVKGATVHIN